MNLKNARNPKLTDQVCLSDVLSVGPKRYTGPRSPGGAPLEDDVQLGIYLCNRSHRDAGMIPICKKAMNHPRPPFCDPAWCPRWVHEQLPAVLHRRVTVEEQARYFRVRRPRNPRLATWCFDISVVLAVIVGLHAPRRSPEAAVRNRNRC